MPSLYVASLQEPALVGRPESDTVAHSGDRGVGHVSQDVGTFSFDREGFETIVSELRKAQAELATIRCWQAEVDIRLFAQEDFMKARANANLGYSEFVDKDPTLRSSRSKETSEAVLERARVYTFDESVYDATLFMLVEYVDWANTMMIFAAFGVNMMLQLGLIIVLNASFIEDPLPDETLEKLRMWRRADAHAFYNADVMTGVSLSARVCMMDEGLSFSTSQVELYKDATHYLDWGIFMGNLAIILWSLTCASKLRKSLQFVLALSNLPKGKNRSKIAVDLTGYEIQDLSIQRFLLGGSVALCQSLIASLLLLYGSWWLAYTISVFDLLLNASALNFIFEIDRIIFSVLLPLSVDGLVTSVQPLRLPRSKTEFRIPSALAISISIFVILVNLTSIQHIHTQIRHAEEILCAERSNVNFIIGTSTAGLSVYATSVSPDDGASPVMVARQTVTQLLIDGNPEANMYVNQVSAATTDRNSALIRSEISRHFFDIVIDSACEDVSGARLGGRLWYITGDDSLKNVTACEQVKSYCRGSFDSHLAKHVRLICPVMCGCADPTSGLWDLASPSAGCPWTQCQVPFRELLDNYECQDKPLEALQMNSSWSSMLNQMRTSGTLEISLFNNLTSKGCEAFQDLDYFKRRRLCGTYDVFSLDVGEYTFVEYGAGILCPESCGCFFSQEYEENMTSEVPEEYWYFPGDNGICPLKTCKERLEDMPGESWWDRLQGLLPT